MPSPYDQAIKCFGDRDPRAFLALFAGIPLTAEVEVVSLSRELTQSPIEADQIYLVADGADRFLIHAEALSRYKSDWSFKQLWYAVEAVRKYQLPIRSYLLLFTADGAPEYIPECVRIAEGGLSVSLNVHVIRLWTMPAPDALRLGSPAVTPWIALMQATVEEHQEAWRRCLAGPDPETAIGTMMLLGSLRYHSKEAFLERLNMFLTPEIIRESPFYKDIFDEGRQEGRQEGREDGQRTFLRRQLVARFGALPPWAESRLAVAHSEALERWAELVLTATSIEEALR